MLIGKLHHCDAEIVHILIKLKLNDIFKFVFFTFHKIYIFYFMGKISSANPPPLCTNCNIISLNIPPKKKYIFA